MLSSEDLEFDDFAKLAGTVQAKLADLYKGIVIGYIGAVVKVGGVKSKPPAAGQHGPMVASVAGTAIPNVTEFRSTSLREGWRQHILVRASGTMLSEVTLDLQKVEAPVWNDLVPLLSQSRNMIEEFVAKLEQT